MCITLPQFINRKVISILLEKCKSREMFLVVLFVVCFRRVEEFKEYGDMDMMMQYVKEVQTVQKKLSDSIEAIGFINEVRSSVCLVSFSLDKYHIQHSISFSKKSNRYLLKNVLHPFSIHKGVSGIETLFKTTV